MRKRYLVCGAGGFIGSHMAQRLYKDGNFVRVVDIKWDGFMVEPHYTEKMTLDLRLYENCLIATKDIDYVFQFAADMGGIGYITTVGADIMTNSALININMLRASVHNRVKRIFFSSSACVYPEFKQLDEEAPSLKEEDAIPAQPDSFYGWEKIFSEQLYTAFHKDYSIEIRIARYHNIYGPYGTYEGGKEKAPAALCRKVALSTNPGVIEIWGDGNQKRSFCYIDDAIEGSIKLMDSNFMGPINIGSDELVTVNQLADIIIDISGKRIEKKYDLSKPQGVRGRNSDNTLIKKILGWSPNTPLVVGIEKTYKWILEDLKKQNRIM